MKIPEQVAYEEKVSKLYNAIDYKDAFNHIRKLADLEWNGKITVRVFRDRICDIITTISEKESK